VHVALSLGYAIIGLMLLAPAVVDAYRYFVPDSRWAPWVSLAGKLTLMGALFAF
jgi:hypothetical protein